MYRALIVEDDPQVARINTGYLERAGFEVVGVAANGVEALNYLQSTPVHLVLLDIYLPGSSGLDVFRELRIDGQAVEVIVVSAAKDSVQIREAFRMGCLDYIIKPFSYERLNTALQKYRQKMDLFSKETLGQEEIDLLAAQQYSTPGIAELPKEVDALPNLRRHPGTGGYVWRAGHCRLHRNLPGFGEKVSGLSVRSKAAAADICLWQ